MAARLDVRKTYKLYIGGEFPRSESGRSYAALDAKGEVLARVARASRKDLREAVRAARTAAEKWAGKSGYNRGQVLYRVAEMMEDRAAVFAEQLADGGLSPARARSEVGVAIDRMVWYAGWADKFSQIYGSLNPVAGPFFNISAPEPTGVVGIITPDAPALLGLITRMAPVIVGGNTAVVIASQGQPLPAITLAEAMESSDVPAGVVNILTGYASELAPWLADHMDVNAIDIAGALPEVALRVQQGAVHNVKRLVGRDGYADSQSPYLIAAFTETKTVWHPKGL
jgi:acyl-CoA reductase-like NAD-dependent aldehyde dehydrogenase